MSLKTTDTRSLTLYQQKFLSACCRTAPQHRSVQVTVQNLNKSTASSVLGHRPFHLIIQVLGPSENNASIIAAAEGAARSGTAFVAQEALRLFGEVASIAPVFETRTVAININPGECTQEEQWLKPVADLIQPGSGHYRTRIQAFAFDLMKSHGCDSLVVSVHPQAQVVRPGTNYRIGAYAHRGLYVLAGEDGYLVNGYGQGVAAHEMMHAFGGVPHPLGIGGQPGFYGYFAVENIDRPGVMRSPLENVLTITDFAMAGIKQSNIGGNLLDFDKTGFVFQDLTVTNGRLSGRIHIEPVPSMTPAFITFTNQWVTEVKVCVGDGPWEAVTIVNGQFSKRLPPLASPKLVQLKAMRSYGPHVQKNILSNGREPHQNFLPIIVRN